MAAPALSASGGTLRTGGHIGIRISGIAEAKKHLGWMRHQIGIWAASQIGAVATVAYSHWINEGFYFGGRPGRTRAVHFMQDAQAAAQPMITAAVAASLAAGGPDASRAAIALSDRIVTLARGFATRKSGNLASGIMPLRGGKFFPV